MKKIAIIVAALLFPIASYAAGYSYQQTFDLALGGGTSVSFNNIPANTTVRCSVTTVDHGQSYLFKIQGTADQNSNLTYTYNDPTNHTLTTGTPFLTVANNSNMAQSFTLNLKDTSLHRVKATITCQN